MRKEDGVRPVEEGVLSAYEACFLGDDTLVSGFTEAKILCK